MVSGPFEQQAGEYALDPDLRLFYTGKHGQMLSLRGIIQEEGIPERLLLPLASVGIIEAAHDVPAFFAVFVCADIQQCTVQIEDIVSVSSHMNPQTRTRPS